jgi:hypothetical protein
MDTTMETPDPLGYQVFHMSKLSVHETEQDNEMLEVPHFNTCSTWCWLPTTESQPEGGELVGCLFLGKFMPSDAPVRYISMALLENVY